MGQGPLLRAKVLFTPRCQVSLNALELSWDVTSAPLPGSYISVKVSSSVRNTVKYLLRSFVDVGHDAFLRTCVGKVCKLNKLFHKPSITIRDHQIIS